MTARDRFPHTAFFAVGPSGGDDRLIERRREAAALLDECDRLQAELDRRLALADVRTRAFGPVQEHPQ